MRLHATGRRQQLREGNAQDFDEVEDSDGEATLLCCQCRLPLGDFAYADGEDEGACHGECLAQLVLERSREADEQRLQKAAETKQQHRVEYGLGWQPQRIPSSADLAVRLGCNPRPRGLCCLAWDEESGMVGIKETFEPAGSINLEYLSLALQVRRSQGTEPYFSLDPVRSTDALKHRTQVKRFEPEWLAGTSVGAVLFQSDYHLKELSMGEYDQPVVGMKSCFEFSEDDHLEKAWNAREWFVVNKADVLLSDDNILIPQVSMGVQAREQQEGPRGMVDKPVTRPDHPLVKYARAFTKHFDLIAERRSAIFHLRELAKACVLAKFLDDNHASLEESWFNAVGTSAQGSGAEIPQLWNERCSSQIAVEDGRILGAKDGIRKGKHGVYGGVQFGLEEVVVSGTYRQPRREPGRMLPEYMTIKLPQPPRFAAKGVDLNLGKFDLSVTKRGSLEECMGSWGSQSVGHDAALGAAFWSHVEGPETPLVKEDRELLQTIFNPRMSDRRAEGARFIPPDAGASYVQGLRRLVKEEEQVREQRREHFLSKDFSVSEPGPLFPSSWAPPFEVSRRGLLSAPCSLRKCQGHPPMTLEDLASALQLFDRTAEDGTRFRIYKHGDFEVRTLKEERGQEVVGVVFATSDSVESSVKGATPEPCVRDDDAIVKATEYVQRSGQGAGQDGRPRFSLYVVLESEQGAAIVTERRCDGTIVWEENPANLEDRNSHAKVVRSADCVEACVCIRDIKAYKASEASQISGGVPQSRCKHYAQEVFALASTGRHQSSSGFWQRSEGLWQLPQAEKRGKQGRWQDGCWQAECNDDSEGMWPEGWGDFSQDWQCEWERGWQDDSRGGRTATVAVAKLPHASPDIQKASRLRRHFELQALGPNEGQMARSLVAPRRP